ncbi:hypothetical protein Tco_1312332 [Tanacetum coccineum]
MKPKRQALRYDESLKFHDVQWFYSKVDLVGLVMLCVMGLNDNPCCVWDSRSDQVAPIEVVIDTRRVKVIALWEGILRQVSSRSHSNSSIAMLLRAVRLRWYQAHRILDGSSKALPEKIGFMYLSQIRFGLDEIVWTPESEDSGF